MYTLKKFFKNNLLIIFAVLLSIVASHSLFHSGLIPTHDGEYHVVRFYEFDKTFRGGDIYPRWAPDLNNGFGIPLFNYVYPLPNYIALIIHSVNFSFIDSFKISLILASIVGSIFMYLWSKDFWGDLGALISSVFYTFSPYHFLDIYVRGSIGEVWALAFFPAFLWAITQFSSNNKKKYFIMSSVFLSLIIFSHNILGLMFFIFAVFYSVFIFFRSQKREAIPMIWIFVLALGITSIFWLPAIFEKQYVRGLEIYDYSKNFPELYQLIFPSWGTGFSTDPLQNQLSFQIGLANLLVIIGGIGLLFRKGPHRKTLIFFISSFFIVLLMMLPISLPAWKTIPLFNYFQFPWRFLSLEILFASFIVGSLMYYFKSKLIAVFLVSLSVILGMGYSNVAYYLERPDSYYTTRPNFIDGTNSSGNTFNTKWMGELKKEKNKISFKIPVTVVNETLKPTYYSFKTESADKTEVTANIAYFPNWTVYINKKIQSISLTKSGLFSFALSKGENQIEIKLEDTNLRIISELISAFSLLALFMASKFVKIIK